MKFCTHCGLKEIRGQAKKFCSMKCKAENQTLLREINCGTCLQLIRVKRSRLKARFCSKKCRGLWSRGKPYPLSGKINLSKAMKGYVKTEEHRKRIGLALSKRTGELSPNWQGGKTKLSILIRNRVRTDEWRKGVFARDNYTCQICSKRGVRLNADHIKPLAMIVKELKITSMSHANKYKELWDINNGRTLCEPCHKETPTFKGKYRTYEKNYTITMGNTTT